jgi:hypothetical protein
MYFVDFCFTFGAFESGRQNFEVLHLAMAKVKKSISQLPSNLTMNLEVGATKFITIIAMYLVTLCCATQVRLARLTNPPQKSGP